MKKLKIIKNIKGKEITYDCLKDIIIEDGFVPNKNDRTFVSEPRDICIELTKNCNLNCKNCFTKKIKKDIKFTHIKRLLESKNQEFIRVCLSGGEPFLYGEIIQCLKYISSIPLVGKIINTNGTLIPKKSIEILKKNYWTVGVSVHGKEKTHNQYTDSTSYEAIIKNIKILQLNGINTHLYSVIHKHMDYDDYEHLISLKSLFDISILRMITVRKSLFSAPNKNDELALYIAKNLKENIIIKNQKSKSYFLNIDGSITISN